MRRRRGAELLLVVGLALLLGGAIWGRADGGFSAGLLGGVGVVLLVAGAVGIGEPRE